MAVQTKVTLAADDAVGMNLSGRQLLTIISYNLHGLNQGLPGINELLRRLHPDIIMIQEHWLTADNLNKLSDISADYFVIGSSAMDVRVAAGPLYGRPFGGTAILISNKLANLTCVVSTSERYTAVKVANWLLVNVYLPCSGTENRLLVYSDIFCELNVIFAANRECDIFVGGDFNSDLNDAKANAFNSAINDFISSSSLLRCDVIFSVATKFTYVNESLNSASAIDYMLTSNQEHTIAFNILDIDLNLSDHLPLMAVCSVDVSQALPEFMPTDFVSHLRWDHAPLHDYYELTRVGLEPILAELNALCDNLPTSDVDIGFVACLDVLYKRVVSVLQQSSKACIPKRKQNFYKFWWNQELDELKSKAMASCRIWKDAGKPRNGPIHAKYIQDKLRYKKRIRDERSQETRSITNDLHDALLNKSGQAFWKTWNSKFEHKSNKIIQVGGFADNNTILNNFAKHFEQVCRPHTVTRNEELKAQYLNMRLNYNTISYNKASNDTFDVQLVSTLLGNMHNGKAAGLDDLTSEHLKFSHPIIVIILCKMFNLFVSFGHIPCDFGASYTVPIPKCDGRCKSLNCDDFRGISISPVISKLFELCILDRYCDYFETSEHQFGFKKQLSCCHVVYSVRNVIDSYIENGSTVNICALDLSKAFDRMNHFALFIKLMERNFPAEILNILEHWFFISQTCVRWGGQDSHFFRLMAGVRQGGVLSPFLFSIFIDGIVEKVKNSNIGCYSSSVCLSIFLYADDILLLSPSVAGLQNLLTVCENELIDLDMRLNVSKSVCLRFGHRFDVQCVNIVSIHGDALQWVNSCRYLGVYFTAGRLFRCCFHTAKTSFFRAFNALYSKIGSFASEEVVLNLIRTKCLPCLLYCVEACPFLKRDKHSFDFSVTRLFMKMLRTSSPAIVADCQVYFNFLPVSYQIDIRTSKFLTRYILSDNTICRLFAPAASLQINNIFHSYGDNVSNVHELYNAVHEQFVNSFL